MENIQFKCEECGRTFARKCNLAQHLKYGSHSGRSHSSEHKTIECLNCGKPTKNSKFCSCSCSVTYNNKSRIVSEEQKIKTSQTLIFFIKENPRLKHQKRINNYKNCKNCNKMISNSSKTGFCQSCLRYSQNDECIALRRSVSLSGGKAAAKAQFNAKRSKNEAFFADLIHSIFIDSKNNEKLFNGWDADIIIPSKKIAILWNGNWHYEDICGQLKQVQNRDKIKYSEIVKAGYMPYIIVDKGKFSEEKCYKEFERFNEFISLLS